MTTRERYQGLGEAATSIRNPENSTVLLGDIDIPYLQ